MADVDVLDRVESGSTDIVLMVEETPGIVLLDAEKFDLFYDRVKAETDKLVADVSTSRGRDEIRAMASKVVKSKTAIDKARLALTAQWREQTKVCNDAGKEIEERLSGLAAQVRAPLTAWEDAEKLRVAECEAAIKFFKDSAFVALGDTAESVRDRGMDVFAREIDEARFADQLDDATEAKNAAIETLRTALTRLEKEEADVAELQRLRQENADREAREIAAQEAAAEAERVKQEAIEAEQRKAQAAQEEADRVARAAEDAARIAREEAEQAARDQQVKRDRAAQAEIDAANERASQAERDRQAEIDRQAAVDAENARLAKVAADEKAERESDQEHRRKIKTAAKDAMITCGASEDTAQKIVLAIIAGEVPAVTLAF
jgi:colicin import membrane protein